VWETRDFAELRYCHYSVAGGGGRPPVHVLVTVDTTPQPLWRLNRTEAEYAQGFGTPNGRPLDPPAHIDGLGIDADWLPVEQEVMATDQVRLITVAPVWPGTGVAQRRALAESVARAFLRERRPSA